MTLTVTNESKQKIMYSTRKRYQQLSNKFLCNWTKTKRFVGSRNITSRYHYHNLYLLQNLLAMRRMAKKHLNSLGLLLMNSSFYRLD